MEFYIILALIVIFVGSAFGTGNKQSRCGRLSDSEQFWKETHERRFYAQHQAGMSDYAREVGSY